MKNRKLSIDEKLDLLIYKTEEMMKLLKQENDTPNCEFCGDDVTPQTCPHFGSLDDEK